MSIPFNTIPIDLRVPGTYIEIDSSKAVQGLSGIPARLLIIGQKLAIGTQPALEPVLIGSIDQARNLFGAGAQITHMIEAARLANPFTEIHAIAQVDANASVKAKATITITGTSSGNGILSVMIAGRLVQANVISGDNAAAIALSLAAAINEDVNLPVTATVGTGASTHIVEIEVKNAGLHGNKIDVRLGDTPLPSSVSMTLGAMQSGAGNPDINAVFQAIGDEWYTDLAVAYTDSSNITKLETHLLGLFSPLKMLDAHAYIGVSGSHSDLMTYGSARNNPHLSIIGAYGSPTPPYEWAASLAAQATFYSKQDPARPFQTLPLTGIIAPKIKDRFTFEQRNLLLNNGISTFTVDNGGQVLIERLITTYQENAQGTKDAALLDMNTVKTLSYLRYDVAWLMKTRYPRYKLADDGTAFARSEKVVTPSVIRATLIARFKLWEEKGLVENITQFKNDLIVERDAEDRGRLNALIPPDIVNGLHIFAGLIQYRL
jgi:phage tail sheath gpL-like